ncbi:hypothetical protein SAMN04488071_0905 [Kordiimonas lacus]|uniref:Uncharacterized protein n=1 Tax=Kordiimonas lacus TaxID=637679 RepID=A0A1G6VYK6_9PROT|nr:hypothetical protein SAMN04488071_0905 [Kordiimonas lacus]
MQVNTAHPIPNSGAQLAKVALPHSLTRLAVPTAFLSELLRTAIRQPHLQSLQSTGEPLRPITFVPLAGLSSGASSGTTSRGKGRKKKSSTASGDDALAGLIGRR